MREILFKAKRLDNGEWVEGYYIGPIGVLDVHEICDVHDITGPRVEVDPSTVCQYTGLKDKNGKRIFEGDNVYDPHENSIYTVEWNAKIMRFSRWHMTGAEGAWRRHTTVRSSATSTTGRAGSEVREMRKGNREFVGGYFPPRWERHRN